MNPDNRTWREKLSDFFVSAGEFVGDFFTVAGLSIDQGFQQLEKTLALCREHAWCFPPTFEFLKLVTAVMDVNQSPRPHHALYVAIRDYFGEGNWHRLDEMVDQLIVIEPVQRKILRDCIRAVRLHGWKHFNAANLVVPTLIAIIDGLLSDFANHLEITNWHKKAGKARLRAALESVAFSFDTPGIDLIFSVLFSTAHYSDKKPMSGRSFNRHWIQHGNWPFYGRMEYVLRLFVIISFVDYIINEYYEREDSGEESPTSEASKYSQLLSNNFIAPMRTLLQQRAESRGLVLANPENSPLYLPGAPEPSQD